MAQAPGTVTNGDTQSQQFAEGVEVPYRKLIPGYAAPSSCLATVQYWVKDLPRGIGVPNNLTPKYTDPFIGAIMLTTESWQGTNTGHAAQVVDYDATYVWARECNVPRGKCGIRKFRRDDVRIRGYEWLDSVL